MASAKDKRKNEKKTVKKNDEGDNKVEVVNIVETAAEEVVTLPSLAEVVEVATVEEAIVSKEPTPEPCYEEPVLTQLILKRYEGQKVQGLYDGEGEAYFVDGNYYKGTFSKGFMHGSGIYLWTDGVTYEGSFIQNQITGKGKYTWPDDSSYEGDVLCGKRHGFGTYRSAEGQLSYAGYWLNGKRSGKGRMEYDAEGKSSYEGDWINGIKHGWGTRKYPSGNIYHGMWFNNVRHGTGTMKWLDRDEIYLGQWENGIQHGSGQHIWLLRRTQKSQYPLRNMYSGDFVNGKRHGLGVFLYANGSKYEGSWRDNMKQGKGKFTFKNGRTYEGVFDHDHIVEYPDFFLDGTNSPDLSKIRTRTPIAADNVSLHSNESRNTVSPSFQLDIQMLLSTLSADDLEYEVQQVMYAITRHVSALHRIYTFYSSLGYEQSPDNTFVMNKMQFWLFLKDIGLHHSKYTITDMDRIIGANYQKDNDELHNPFEKILQRQFVNYLIILSHLLFNKEHQDTNETGPLLEYCFSRLMQERILCHACNVRSSIYSETRRAVNVLEHVEQAYQVYQAVCTPRKHTPREPVFKMRQFVFLLKDLGLINKDLTAKAVIKSLAHNNPSVHDGEGCYNLELEMTFLEFMEALVHCAERYVTELVIADPTTPRVSSVRIQEQSYVFMAGSPSLQASQIILEEMERLPLGSLSQAALDHDIQHASLMLKPSKSDHLSRRISEAIPKQDSQQDIKSPGIGDLEVPLTSIPASQKSLPGSVVQASQTSLNHTPQSEAEDEMLEDEGEMDDDDEYDDGEEEEDETEITSPVTKGEEDTNLVDEPTRKFNLWTHQVHIFFIRKFFPRAEKYLQMKKYIEAAKEEEELKSMREQASESQIMPSQKESSIQFDGFQSPEEIET